MIELADVRVTYGKTTVLDVPSLALHGGQVTAVLGLNGSGKTTLLKAMLSLVPSCGRVTVGGADVSRMGSRERAGLIAYLPQHCAVANMDVMTLVSHGRYPRVGFGRSFSEADRSAVEHALLRTDLWHKRDSLLRTLSGGELQRAYLAMVIAQDTPFLLLDEPGTYMDVRHQGEVMDLLRSLGAEGKGIVLTTHDLPQAFTMSDRLCVLSGGTVALSGTPADVAMRQAELEKAMGVRVAPLDDARSLYRYQVIRTESASFPLVDIS